MAEMHCHCWNLNEQVYSVCQSSQQQYPKYKITQKLKQNTICEKQNDTQYRYDRCPESLRLSLGTKKEKEKVTTIIL